MSSRLGDFLDVTYVDDHLTERARQLNDALEAGATVVSLSGPSKSGKTTFAEKVLGLDRLVHVTGAGVADVHKLWDRVFDLIATPVSQRTTKGSFFDGATSGKVTAGASLVVASGGGELGASGKWGSKDETQTEAAVAYLQLLIRELSGTNLMVFIDDFHYIPREVQVEVANQITECIRNGLNFVVASVPYHSDDAIRANPDLRGRAIKIDFDYWKPAELAKIAERGFAALNVQASPEYIHALAAEAAGSPQLMQSLCLTTCFENNVRAKEEATKALASDRAAIERVCTRTAATVDYSSTVAKMKEGPKIRGQGRNAYALKDGAVSDVYPLIITAIASDPPELTQRYANLQKRIQALCATETPSGSSVAGACHHIAAIANEAENRSVIEWDADNDVLDMRYP